MTWKESRAEFWKKADELITAGCSSKEIGKQLGVTHPAVLKYLKRSGKHEEWKEKKQAVLYSSRDELIAQGLSKDEIAVREGLTLNTIDYYIRKSGQREVREEKRKKMLEEQAQRINAAGHVLGLEEQLTQTSSQIERIILDSVRQQQTVNSRELRTQLREDKSLYLSQKEVMQVLRKHQISQEQNRFRTIPLILPAPRVDLGLKTKGDYSNEEREEVLKCVQNEQPVTIYQVIQRTNISRESIINILKDENLITFIPGQKKRRPELDQFIAQGLTLTEIGQKNKVTIQRVMQYVNATGQYDNWSEQSKRRKAEKREKKGELPHARQELTNLLISRAYQKAEEGGWEYHRKALDYYYGGLKDKNKRKNTVGRSIKTPLEKLLTLFETYEMGKHLRVKLSLKELEERTGINFSYIGKILNSRGLEPMFGARERSSNLPPEKVQAIERAYGLKFTYSDVAYFLGLSENPWVVTCHFAEIRRSGAEKIKRKHWLFLAKQEFGTGTQKSDYLFYRTASQIYELDDLAREEKIDFPDEEVAKLLEIRPKCVEHARKQRWRIEYDLKRLLRVLYSEREGDKPYL